MADHNAEVPKEEIKKNFVQIGLENIIFNVKWILPLFYAGLVVVLAIYGVAYAKEIYTIVQEVGTTTTDKMKITALDSIDIVMIANLMKMIITGSWNSFVSKEHGRKNENVNSATLKTKIATSILVVSSIHMLKLLVKETTVPIEELIKCGIIYVLFIITAIALGWLEHWHNQDEIAEKEHEK